MFKKRKRSSYDHDTQKPAIRCSICTGEQVAGFVDINSGSFSEICLIRNDSDLCDFKEKYDITGEIEKIY